MSQEEMTVGKTLAEMTAEVREINVAKGWRPAEGGPGEHTFGDYVALLHSELSEALEAYRDHRLADATVVEDCEGPVCDIHGHEPIKPEGVGSEFADVLIRQLDMCDVFGIRVYEMDLELGDVTPLRRGLLPMASFGDHVTWMHRLAADMGMSGPEGPHADRAAARMLRGLVSVAETYGIDLGAEYKRKVAFNRTRTFQHGGRTLAGEK